MRAIDFEFDGHCLSEFGFIICRFDSSGVETIDGAEITFNTVSTLNGKKSELVSTVYEMNLETVIQICKNPCFGGDMEISSDTFRELSRWLGKHKFLKLKILDEDHIDIYYEAAFPVVNRIEINGKIVGLELNIITNAPYAYKEPVIKKINNTPENISDGKIHSLFDPSHEEGYIYPFTQIEILEDGDLEIYNALEDRTTHIKNCISGEVIIMDYPMIQSSVSSHGIQDDFNWEFFRIANTFENRRNDLTISLPCKIEIRYSPIIKMGL